ncbi:sesquipedalian-1 isoform X1 [Drosophila busckii]|uniref:sesquipedalian-1 isoform X1 n=1 Tax=Drosophila busckii TaxID=30019 RepID=UPI00143297BC|nr:sesquipedalian-1 isoform X1 [Drosophila busckii]
MKINEKNLCVFARTPPFDMEGFLNKRGEINKAFQRRYFVLKGNLLFYFESRLDKEPLGLIIVEGCTIELSSHELESDNYCFEIAFNGNRTYVLGADSQDIMEAWMKALTCAGYDYKRIIVAELQRQLQEIEDSRNKVPDTTIESDALGKPKPPPRRQNPFNRPAPAPPLPHDNGLRGGVVMSPMPFIPGYFGSSKQQQEHQQLMDNKNANCSDNPQRTPKGTRRQAPGVVAAAASGAAPHSVFYKDQPVAPARSAALQTISNNNVGDRAEQQRRCAQAIEDFKRDHERYREHVMPDIIAYRQRHKQPLIQF